jgi:hypothetical protein
MTGMAELATPIVQVVTGGTDWTAVASAIAGGIVGVVGIVVGLLTGKHAREAASKDLLTNIKAANERVLLAEKRRIYASCLSAINAANSAFSLDRRARNWPDKDARMEAWEEARKAYTDMLNAVMELELIARKDVSEAAEQIRDNLTAYWAETKNGSEAVDSPPSGEGARMKLRSAMRTDLGEPPN